MYFVLEIYLDFVCVFFFIGTTPNHAMNIFADTVGIKGHFQQYYSYILVVSFIGRGNRRKTLTYIK